MKVGQKLVAKVPVEITDGYIWEPGTIVEIVSKSDHEKNNFGSYSVQLEDKNGEMGSFAEIDLEGESAWFHALE